jgi:terminase small subunit-like protein
LPFGAPGALPTRIRQRPFMYAPGFRRDQQYARARELQAHYFERIVQIAFDDKGDFFVDGDTGKIVSDHVRVARAGLQVDALKWASAKLLPKVYGDRGDRHEQDEKPQANGSRPNQSSRHRSARRGSSFTEHPRCQRTCSLSV